MTPLEITELTGITKIIIMKCKIKQISNGVDFIGIGAQKCATTWIAQCLAEHPEICLAQPKEVNFFNKRGTFYLRDKEWNYPKGISWYESHFSHCSKNKIKGEFSPNYLYDEKAPFLIKKHFLEVKIIVSLRNPIQRAFSQYHHAKERKKIKSSFEKTIQQEPEFIERGLYYKQLKRYFDLFPKKNILVSIYEEIEKDPTKFIQNIYQFLGVEPNFIPPSLNKRPRIGHYHHWGFKVLVKYPPLLKLVKKIGVMKEYLRIHPQTKKNLQKNFEEDIGSLEQLLKKDLSFWK